MPFEPLGHRRQLLLFLGAILVPCAALALLSFRIISQDRQLGEKRRMDERRDRIERTRLDLLARLEAIKPGAVLAAGRPDFPWDPAVALIAVVHDDRLVLPWEAAAAASAARSEAAEPRVGALLRQGELEEFGHRNPGRAAPYYGAAVAAAHAPDSVAGARLAWARALCAANQRPAAAAEFRRVLAVPATLEDEDGVPFALHASEGLLRCGDGLPGAIENLRAVIRARPWLSPVACYAGNGIAERLLRDAETPAQREQARALQAELAARVRVAGQAESLQNEYQRLGLFDSAARPRPIWASFGEDPWLVGAGSRTDGTMVILAVRAAAVLEPVAAQRGVRFRPAHDSEGEALGAGFPGLKVQWASPVHEGSAWMERLQYGVFLAALALLLGGTSFGAWLLWRDLSREMRLAEVRAQFVSSVSHELKTPLTSIRMFAETLQMGRLPDETVRDEYLETIVNECARLSRLVDDVLLFSKIEQGKKQYRLRPVMLQHVVRSAARTLAYQLSQHGFELALVVDDSLPPVPADRDAIEQAVLNLLTNAMKYSGDARRIEVEAARHGGEAVIRVTDHGLGIAPEEQARIFEKFYRVPMPENQSIPGTGLGLTLVQQILRGHSGRVTVESVPGQGSTFSMYLPLEGES
jgi:signal transduction histidine kinase